jgi:hypothetical protein
MSVIESITDIVYRYETAAIYEATLVDNQLMAVSNRQQANIIAAMSNPH